jgi:hypothetical protein
MLVVVAQLPWPCNATNVMAVEDEPWYGGEREREKREGGKRQRGER